MTPLVAGPAWTSAAPASVRRVRRSVPTLAREIDEVATERPRARFHDLPDAQRRLERTFTHDIIVERWSLASFIRVTRTCKLYDYDARRWLDFDDRARTSTL